MDQIAAADELPPGCRSDLACALYTDDSESLLKYLKVYSQMERDVFFSEQGGKMPDEGNWSPWPSYEVEQSPLRIVDDSLYVYLIEDDRELCIESPASLYTVVFVAAAAVGSVRCLTVLLSDKYISDVNPGYDMNKASMEACCNGRIEVMKVLMKDKRIDISDDKNASIRMASRNGPLELVKLLLTDQRVNPADNQNAAIGGACYAENLEVIKFLLNDTRVDPSDNNNDALSSTCFYGKFEVLKLLLNDSRVDPSANNNKAILDVFENDHFEMAEFLLSDLRVDPSPHCGIIVPKALKWSKIDILRLLLKDSRIFFTNKLLSIVDCHDSSDRVDALFGAAGPRFWPTVIGNEVACVSRESGQLRRKLDDLEVETSRILLLCVKYICSKQVAARIGDVLRDVCEEWTTYRTVEEK